ncbi:MAG: Calx-beta domain-containing protein [Bacteroidia bacterium]
MKLLFFFFLSTCSILSYGCDPGTPTPVEVPPVLSIQGLSVVESNDTKPVFVNLRLDKIAEKPVTFVLNTADGTAVAGEDFIPLTSKSVTINAGEIQGNCRIDIIGDEEFEEDETFTVLVSQLDGATSTQDLAIIEILNDDLNTNIDIPTTGYTPPRLPIRA